MHFRPALTLFRHAVNIDRERERDTVGITIREGGNNHPANDHYADIRCQMITEVGFTTTTQDQPQAGPITTQIPNARELQNVILADKTILTKAMINLHLVARTTGVYTGTQGLLSRNQAFANLSGNQWTDFDINQNRVPSELVEACYTGPIRDTMFAQTKNPDHKPKVVVLFCNIRINPNNKDKHLHSHKIKYDHLPLAVERQQTTMPQAYPDDDQGITKRKLEYSLSMAKHRMGLFSNRGRTSNSDWTPLRRLLSKFFKNAPLAFKTFRKAAEQDTGVKNLGFDTQPNRADLPIYPSRLIGWVAPDTQPTYTTWKNNLAATNQNKATTTLPAQQQSTPQAADTRADKADPTAPTAGESAHQQATGAGNAPFKERYQDDSPAPRTQAQARPENQIHQAGTHGEHQAEENTQTTYKSPSASRRITAEQNTDHQDPTTGNTQQQTIAGTTPKTRARNVIGTPQSNLGINNTTSLPDAPEPRKDQPGTTNHASKETTTQGGQQAQRPESERDPTTGSRATSQPVQQDPTTRPPIATPNQNKEIEVTINMQMQTNSGTTKCQYQNTRQEQVKPEVANNAATTLAIKVAQDGNTEHNIDISTTIANKITGDDPPTSATGDAANNPTDRQNSHDRDNSPNTDWYSMILEEETDITTPSEAATQHNAKKNEPLGTYHGSDPTNTAQNHAQPPRQKQRSGTGTAINRDIDSANEPTNRETGTGTQAQTTQTSRHPVATASAQNDLRKAKKGAQESTQAGE